MKADSARAPPERFLVLMLVELSGHVPLPGRTPRSHCILSGRLARLRVSLFAWMSLVRRHLWCLAMLAHVSRGWTFSHVPAAQRRTGTSSSPQAARCLSPSLELPGLSVRTLVRFDQPTGRALDARMRCSAISLDELASAFPCFGRSLQTFGRRRACSWMCSLRREA